MAWRFCALALWRFGTLWWDSLGLCSEPQNLEKPRKNGVGATWASIWPQDGPTGAPGGPKSAPGGHKTAPRALRQAQEANSAPRGLKTASRALRGFETACRHAAWSQVGVSSSSFFETAQRHPSCTFKKQRLKKLLMSTLLTSAGFRTAGSYAKPQHDCSQSGSTSPEVGVQKN